MAPNPVHPGNLQQQIGESAAQSAEQMKKQQYEEQQRKLREISNRGIKSKSKDGKNLIDDFMSKTDLNLSSNLKQHSKSATPAASTQGNRQMNVFSGKYFQLYGCQSNKLSIVSNSYTVLGTVFSTVNVYTPFLYLNEIFFERRCKCSSVGLISYSACNRCVLNVYRPFLLLLEKCIFHQPQIAKCFHSGWKSYLPLNGNVH